MTAATNVVEMPHKLSKYGEGGVRQIGPSRFQISFYDAQGERRRQSYTTYAKAEKELKAYLTLREKGKLDPKEGRVRIDTLAAAYMVYARNSAPKSYNWIEIVWRCHLEPFFGGRLADRVTSDHLDEYIRARLDVGAATVTVNRELTVFKAMLNHAFKCDPPKIGRVPRFPEKLREANPRSGFVNDDEYAQLKSKCKHVWLRTLLALAYTYGFRKSELMGLRVSQIDLKGRTIHLSAGTTKSDKGVFNLVSECVKGKQPADALFTRPNGEGVSDFRKAWRGLVKSAGMDRLLLHDFRRAAVRNMLRGGISKQVAKKISGHSTDAIFDRYDILEFSDLEDAARKMEIRANGHELGTAQSQGA